MKRHTHASDHPWFWLQMSTLGLLATLAYNPVMPATTVTLWSIGFSAGVVAWVLKHD